jgi:hypothetical protein
MERFVTGAPSGRAPGGRRPRFGNAAGPLARLSTLTPLQATLWLSAAFAVVLLLYLLSGSLLLLLLLVAVAAVGADRLVRMHPEARFYGPTATLLYLFVPALYALGAGLLLGEWSSGLWDLPAALLGAVVFGITANTEYLTVDPNDQTYEAARFALLLVIYLVAAANFIVVFAADLNLIVGAVFVGATAFLLTMDMLRELETDTGALLVQAGAVALVMAEARLAVYFTPLADVFAGSFLLLAFYVITTMVQSLSTGRLDNRALRDLALVVLAGLAIILIGSLLTA